MDDNRINKLQHEIYNVKAFMRLANDALKKYESWDELGEIYAFYLLIYNLIEEIEDSI